jgi:redox-sensing transcriptional repressor
VSDERRPAPLAAPGDPGLPAWRRIPEATVLRLPIYQRILGDLVRSGTRTVSSERLAELARVNAAKVRKDLSLLGSFGTRGSGYHPEYLIAQIDRALGVDENWSVGIVGVGNLGRALTNSTGFASRGFHITALFDVDPAVVGHAIGEITVRHMDEIAALTTAERPDIGVIATPGWAAQGVADLLVRAGVTSLLNFAPRVLTVPPAVHLRYVDLSIELQVLGFYRQRHEEPCPPASGALEARPAQL